MAAHSPFYKYDLLEGHAMAAQNQEDRRTKRILYAALAVSSLLNLLLVVKWLVPRLEETDLPHLSRSSYAGLLNDVPVQFKWNSEYSDVNNPQLDELWQFDGMFDYGMIALTDTEIDSMSLLPSEQSFPWDPENKSLYHLNGHHGLHCLRLIYTSISSYRASTPQKTPFPHILHCLDNLRQDIICAADDSPRYLTNNGSHSGESQVRFCRDFGKLNDWARERDACFRQQHDLADVMEPIEKFTYCKTEENRKKYLDQVKAYFDLPSGWQFPEPGVPNWCSCYSNTIGILKLDGRVDEIVASLDAIGVLKLNGGVNEGVPSWQDQGGGAKGKFDDGEETHDGLWFQGQGKV
ncbi:hypothetical protein KVR01_013370 [Diaporthe batatas]|uniref:uncharacterized protein n=1 Tax=Diaporthe batatas TaxID=748121 RepID=UPI001D04BCD2|nr:uncharacterized protein KVR01_013370 [Diaporthe batatas]KAG8156765.1 hypothetical protein KVR01_013370 [Diaporthe batatas]